MFQQANVTKKYTYTGFDLEKIKRGDLVLLESFYNDYSNKHVTIQQNQEIKGVVDDITDKYMKVNAGVFTHHITPEKLISIKIYKEEEE